MTISQDLDAVVAPWVWWEMVKSANPALPVPIVPAICEYMIFSDYHFFYPSFILIIRFQKNHRILSKFQRFFELKIYEQKICLSTP